MKHSKLALYSAIPLLVASTAIAETTFSPLPFPAKTHSAGTNLKLDKNSRIGFIGGGLGSRMNLFSEFETELQLRFPQNDLYIRNFCKEGDTPGFRPHPSRPNFYAFPEAKKLMPKEFQKGQGVGIYPSADQWLKNHKIDTLVGFFGYTSSFAGATDVDRYKKELSAFIDHTMKQNYSGKGKPQLAIVSPAAFEDLSADRDLPNGEVHNKNLKLYTTAMAEVCKEKGVLFIDAFTVTNSFYNTSKADLTSNGHNLTRTGYRHLSGALADGLFGKVATKESNREKTQAVVTEKNRLWLLDYKIANGVHVHGRRFEPFGNVNYPTELKKTRQMTEIRDQAIWASNTGKSFDVAAADAKTVELVKVETNFQVGAKKMGGLEYKTGQEVQKTIKMAPGYKIELFADEIMFPNLANPSQMAFDNQGRLWVGCMGSYPHYKIGDPAPNDKILIFEDTDNDGKADKETIFVENIHIPMGFEITDQGGAYVSLGNDLVHFLDTDGDSKADKKEFVLSGFDDHDTHHAISSFCSDPSGAIFMGEGIFLHSNVETPYGTVRGSNGGFYRFDPKKGKLERAAQYSIPNPWGIAFTDWGQNFFLWTSNTNASWMQEIAVKNRYGVSAKPTQIVSSNAVRPTSGLEFVSSRHFPDEVQGDMILCNNIGFLGAKQHTVSEDKEKGGFTSKFRHDLFQTDYLNFRPVDLEFAPDGSLFVIDWQNALIGHMQHNARDPHRDHVHGRIYRVTYPSRPLVKPAKIAGAPIADLLENLKLPEYRSRYRTRRELRGRDANEVSAAVTKWVAALDTNDEKYEHHLTEALWVSWGINKIDTTLVEKVLNCKEPKAIAQAIRAVRYNPDEFPNKKELLVKAAGNENWLVRHEAVCAASWLGSEITVAVIDEAEKKPVKKASKQAFKLGRAHGTQTDAAPDKKIKVPVPKGLPKEFHASYKRGALHWNEGESCGSCHGKEGKGIPPVFPPLAGSEWVNGDKELLAKIALHGLNGPIKVKGTDYPGNVPMPGFAYRMKNKDIADLLTYLTNSFGNIPANGKRTGFTEKEIETLLKTFPKTQSMHNAADLIKKHKVPGQ